MRSVHNVALAFVLCLNSSSFISCSLISDSFTPALLIFKPSYIVFLFVEFHSVAHDKLPILEVGIQHYVIIYDNISQSVSVLLDILPYHVFGESYNPTLE